MAKSFPEKEYKNYMFGLIFNICKKIDPKLATKKEEK